MTPTDIRNALFQMRDEPYRAFQAKLIPAVDPDAMIGCMIAFMIGTFFSTL